MKQPNKSGDRCKLESIFFTTGVQSLLVPTLIHLLQPISLQRPMNMTVHDRPKQKWLAFWGSNLNPSSDPDLKVRRLINRLIISSSTGRSFYTSNASLSVWNLRTLHASPMSSCHPSVESGVHMEKEREEQKIRSFWEKHTSPFEGRAELFLKLEDNLATLKFGYLPIHHTLDLTPPPCNIHHQDCDIFIHFCY